MKHKPQTLIVRGVLLHGDKPDVWFTDDGAYLFRCVGLGALGEPWQWAWASSDIPAQGPFGSLGDAVDSVAMCFATNRIGIPRTERIYAHP